MGGTNAKSRTGLDLGIDVNVRGRVVTNDDHSQMGMDALFGQMSDAGLEVGLNLGRAGSAVQALCCHNSSKMTVALSVLVRVSQGRLEAECSHDAPTSPCFKDGKGSTEDGSRHGVPPEVKGQRFGEKKRCEYEGPSNGGETSDKAGSLSSGVNIALDHDVKTHDEYLKRCFSDGCSGANGGTRTPDRLITNQTHYQLCYVGFS